MLLKNCILFLLLSAMGCSSDRVLVSNKKVLNEENSNNQAKILSEPNTLEHTDISIKEKEAYSSSGPTRTFNPDNFIDMTKEIGLEDLKAFRLYAVDFDQDFHDDLVVLESAYAIPEFYRYHPGEKKYKKITYNPFYEEQVRASYLVFADFNNDAVIDVLAGTLNQKSELAPRPLRIFKGSLKGSRVKFKEEKNVFSNLGPLPSASVSVLDFDLDGKLDLFVANWYEMQKGLERPRPDRLLKGNGLSFQDVSYLLEGETEFDKSTKTYPNARPTFSSGTCDLDNNGLPDILTSSSSGVPNRLWMNLKKNGTDENQFIDLGKDSGYYMDKEGESFPTGGGNSQYALCLDYNNDGIWDVITGEIAHYYESENRDRSAILTGMNRSFPPKFLRTEYHSVYNLDKWNQGDRRAIYFDYNLDKLTDIFVENSGFPPQSRLILFEQESNHAYTDVAENLGINILNPSGIVKIDFNQDGLMDFIVGQTDLRIASIKPRVWAYKNISKRHGRRSITFYLNGERANSWGIGSVVTLKTKQGEYQQWVEFSNGNLPGQNARGIHFGLGDDELEYVEVKWPIKVEDKLERNVNLIKRYDLSNFRYQEHVDVTLCEGGRYVRGRLNCNN